MRQVSLHRFANMVAERHDQMADYMQRQAPVIQKVPKTVEVPQLQHIDEISDEPIVAQRQVPVVQTVQKTVDVPQVQFSDRVADVPVVTQKHVPDPLIQEEIVEVILLTRVCDSSSRTVMRRFTWLTPWMNMPYISPRNLTEKC